MNITSAAAIAFCVLSSPVAAYAAPSTKISHQAEKQAAVRTIEANAAKMTALSDEIWAHAETALKEHKSSKALADWAEAAGFRVSRGVAGMPTAFVAEYGSGSPVIGIMGEFDALPGVSQKAQPSKEPYEVGAAGHGCGHNMFGVASLGAAIAIKDLIASGRLAGTIRFSGTPAEEAVGGKESFLGTQGYVWDTQSDMFLAGVGAVLALLTLGRLHDRQLQNVRI